MFVELRAFATSTTILGVDGATFVSAHGVASDKYRESQEVNPEVLYPCTSPSMVINPSALSNISAVTTHRTCDVLIKLACASAIVGLLPCAPLM